MPKSIRRNRCSPLNQRRSHAHQQSGFTIMEAAIAMVIMMVAVLGSASVFSYSINYNSGATDRELAMALAQQQMEQLRNVSFTDTSLDATAGITTTVVRAGRSYTVTTTIAHSNTVNGQPTMKTITTQVTPLGSTLGSVILRTQRATILDGPF
jgi:Tfp pilus assembly protein PilV